MSHPVDPMNGEPLIALTQAARKYPGHRGAARLHPATLTRWILAGVRAPDGRRVRLEAVRVGCRWLTSEAALARFAAALTPRPGGHPAAAAEVRTPHQRDRAADQAAAALIRAGA
jgi:hypothetical protein